MFTDVGGKFSQEQLKEKKIDLKETQITNIPRSLVINSLTIFLLILRAPDFPWSVCI